MESVDELEARLASAERRYDELFEFLPAALAEFALDSLRVTRLNLVGRIISGYTEEDIAQGLLVTDFATPAAMVLFHNNVTKLVGPSLESGEPYQRRMEQNILETTLQKKDGSTYPAEVQGAIVTDAQGKPIGFQVIARDITARKEAEVRQQRLMAELSSARAEARSLAELLPVCAWCRKVRDDDGYWGELEKYVQARHGTSLSHGICPDCARQFVNPDGDRSSINQL